MNADIKPQINTARHLADDVARIGALSRHRFNGRGSETDNDRSRDEVEERHSSQVGALPVSAPNSIADKLLNVYVADEKTREELCEFVGVLSLFNTFNMALQRTVYRRSSRICSISASVSSMTC